MMKKGILPLCLIMALSYTASLNAEVLSLDSCRALAMRNNKQIEMSQYKVDAANFTKKGALANYFPKMTAAGTYMYNSKQVSILNDEQKGRLESLGSDIDNPLVSAALKSVGLQIEEAFETDNTTMAIGVVNVTQPVFMGGKIVAYNKITKDLKELSENQLETTKQEVLESTDQIYWQVVSLSNKLKLCNEYIALLNTLDDNVSKLIRQGVATNADALTVKVKINEAEMTKAKVENGLALSRMLLCQTCGLNIYNNVTLEDENLDSLLISTGHNEINVAEAVRNRPEIKSLNLAQDIYHQKVNVEMAGYLPNVVVMGNYIISNPNMLNGFDHTFKGFFNVGVGVKIPITQWGEGAYKIKAAKAEEKIAQARLEETEEKINLQINQMIYKLDEAGKQLSMAMENEEKASENLRHAQIGFDNGIIPASTVLEAHTAWMKARTERIDAQVGIRLSETALKKAVGELTID